MFRRIFTLSIAITLTATLTVHAQNAKIKTEKNIVYGKGGDVDLELDLAMPAEGKGPFPAVVCVHGGGWKAGNRQSLGQLTEILAKHNFVAVTVTYRFAPKHKFPAQIEDCKASVRWLRAKAEKYNINPDKIGAVGFSAGGHLVSLMGAADEKAGFEGNGGNPKQSSKVHAVVSFFGPTDFVERPGPTTSRISFSSPSSAVSMKRRRTTIGKRRRSFIAQRSARRFVLPWHEGPARRHRTFAENGEDAEGPRRLRGTGDDGRRSSWLERREVDEDAQSDGAVLRGEAAEMTRIYFASLPRERGEERGTQSPPPANAGGSLITVAKLVIAAFVLASLLFAHGCHGNEDHELFTAFTQWVVTR